MSHMILSTIVMILMFTPLDSDKIVVEEIDLGQNDSVQSFGKGRSLKRIKSNGTRNLPRGSRTCDS